MVAAVRASISTPVRPTVSAVAVQVTEAFAESLTNSIVTLNKNLFGLILLVKRKFELPDNAITFRGHWDRIGTGLGQDWDRIGTGLGQDFGALVVQM